MTFAGREAELAGVLDAVSRVPTAGLVVAAVSGAAGIGKSRLLAEVAARLGERGWRVLAVAGDRLERRVPYGVLAASVRGLTPDNAYTEGLRQDALAVLEADEASFPRACAALTRLLTAMSAAGPTAVLADDLPDLDDDSLALFTVVLRRLAAAPIALVTAARGHLARPCPAAEELLARLGERGELVTVTLGPLDRDEIAGVIAPVLGEPPDEGLSGQIHARAGGNPFFAIEIARSLDESGEIRLAGTGAVLRRVVAPAARPVAQALAVLEAVELERLALVAEVAGEPAATVAAAFDELVRTAVVVRDGQRRYRFAHRIVAEALYEEIGPAQRRRLHARAARPMLAARERGEPTDLLDLARHLAASATHGDATAVAVLAEAARHALRTAPDAAAGFCERALAVLGPGAPERAGLLALRSRALARAGRPEPAVEPGREALTLLPAGEERYRTATTVVTSLYLLDRIDEAIEVADGEIAVGRPPAAMQAQRAVMLAFAGRPEEAARQGERAAACRPGSPAEEVVVCEQLAILASMLGRHADTVALGDRALRAGGDSLPLRLQALAVCASTEALAGLVTRAGGRLREATELAGDSPHRFTGELALTRVVLDWLGGRWETALAGLRTTTAELTVRRQALLAAALGAVELEMRTWRGEFAAAARLAALVPPRMPNLADLHAWALAGYRAATGDPAAAATLRAALDQPGGAPYGCLLLSRLLELDPPPGERDALVKELVATPPTTPWAATTLHRTLGLVHRDPPELRRAVAEAESGGLAFERARAQLALGDLVDDEVPALDDAYRLFARLGAHGLRRRAGRRLHELGAKVPRARAGGAGLLTESEERVARLVQQGMRNREIAGALHYSPRSIEVYLSRIYAKLHVSSRLELARALDQMDARSHR
ncbi:ATP-binding protein [Actinoplanes subtropicus]|uniref:ATP-binding protein n=1 Tax=Actinoplanes subtropicus TaxID=543632 RepID=UPI0004C422D7|nr:LuxR family transcriptional regulator [Actinoplanes subtropicus]